MQIATFLAPFRRKAGRRRPGLRWLLLAWALAALTGWFVPWQSSPGESGLGPPAVALLAALGAPAGWGLVLASLFAWRAGWPRRAVLAAILAGLLHTLSAAGTQLAQTPSFDQRIDCLIAGRVAGLVDAAPDRQRFRLVVREATPLAADDALAARVCEPGLAGTRLRLSDYRRGEARVPLVAGHRYRLVARLKPLHGHANSGGFDYRRWLFRHRIVATGYLREPPVAQPGPRASRCRPSTGRGPRAPRSGPPGRRRADLWVGTG